jgi:hypothetical protein
MVLGLMKRGPFWRSLRYLKLLRARLDHWHFAKRPQHNGVAEFTNGGITRSAECDGADVANDV